MAIKILVLGNSGSGKSTAISNLDEKETFIIKCIEKDLPFRGSSKKYSTVNKNVYTMPAKSPTEVLKNANVINNKAINGFLDFSKIEFKNGVLSGLTEQIEEIKKTDSYLFKSDKEPEGVVPSTSTNGQNLGEEKKTLAQVLGKLYNKTK